jgi:RNA polymerase sigma-70 factor (ECF subfamily)
MALLSQSESPHAEPLGLAARIARGETGAFELLVELYQPRVTRLAHRLLGWAGDVDDVVQDVFLAALRNSGGFRSESSLWTWLTAITLNRCRSGHRRTGLLPKLMAALGRPRAAAAADEETLRDEMAREVRSAVAALPPRDREVIVLFYLEHQSSAQMSEVLGVSTNAIGVRLHRARGKLRTALAELMKE